MIRILVLAVTLLTGLMTVSAQTVEVQVTQRTPILPTAATNYLDDPFRYFNVLLIVNGAGSEGVEVFYDMEFTISTSDFSIYTKPGSVPSQPILLHEGANPMKRDVLMTQLRNGRFKTNIDFKHPAKAQQMPEGTYKLCMDVYLWSDRTNPNRQPISNDICPEFEMCYSGSAPELVSPLAGAQLALNGAMVVIPSRKVNFFWTPVISNCLKSNNTRFKYRLKVVKVVNGQNYQDAIKRNPTAFSMEVRNSNFAVFDTLRDIKVQMERGALYVAQVQAEPIKTNRATDAFIIANDGKSQPMPFFWDYPDDSWRAFGYSVDDESEEGDDSEGIDGLTQWEGGVEEVSGLDDIMDETTEPAFVGFSPKRHYVESDGYYTIPMTDDIEVRFTPAEHESLEKVTYTMALYEDRDGDVDSITAYEPLFSEKIEDESLERTLTGWGTKLKQGNLYYLQLSCPFPVSYWNYSIADTNFYVNEMLAEHFHDTISREFVEEELTLSDGVFFQWGDDPEVPAFTTPQWKAPVNRTNDDIYDPANYELPASVPEIQKAKTFPVSWNPVKNVSKGDEVEYEVTVYELKPDQTWEEAVSTNDELVSRTVTNATTIPSNDTKFFKVFSPGKTYVMTLSTNVTGDSETIYHFENGNEALPAIFKIVK
ncbi:MAG: hypothetical protein J6P73_08730 [Bacteroidales bacterium]|nr:hypothetical protein [Bacteroidales bacterium]